MTLPTYPSHIDLESCNVCNLGRCIMCPYPQMKRPKGFMDIELIKKITQEVKGRGIQTSYQHQIGEPLLHPQIFEIIRLVSKAGIRTSISTNGLLLQERKKEILECSSLNELTLALDGVTKDTYEHYRRSAQFETILFNIMDFLSDWGRVGSHLHVQIQMISMEKNRRETGKLREAFGKFVGRGSLEILVKPFSTFAGKVKDLGGSTPSRRSQCSKPFREMTVLWDGKVSLCCRDYDHFAILGDLNKQSVHEVWNGKDYHQIRDIFRRGKQGEIPLCRHC